MIVAVDFDGTLCHSEYPSADDLDMLGISILKSFRDHGGKVVLWTCRHGEALDNAITACHNAGLEFDAVNADEPEQLRQWQALTGEDGSEASPKIYADLYIDDRALINTDKIPWNDIYKRLSDSLKRVSDNI